MTSEPLVFYTWKPVKTRYGPPDPTPIVRTIAVWSTERTGERQDHATAHALELLWRASRSLFVLDKDYPMTRKAGKFDTGLRLPFGFAYHGKLYGRVVIQGVSYLRSTEVQRLTPKRCRQLSV